MCIDCVYFSKFCEINYMFYLLLSIYETSEKSMLIYIHMPYIHTSILLLFIQTYFIVSNKYANNI